MDQNTPTQVNGRSSTIGGLQLERARAVEHFLTERGIDWRRIKIGHGRIDTNGSIDNMSIDFILKNPGN